MKNLIHAHLLQDNVPIRRVPVLQGLRRGAQEGGEPAGPGIPEARGEPEQGDRRASTTIREKARSDPDAILLMSIPGISFFSALLIVSQKGEIGRFEDSPSLVAYSGLAPSTHSSGGKTYHGPIMKSGSKYLRWVMGQCARAHMRAEPDGTVVMFYARIKRKKPHLAG
jgi:transposase